MQRQLNLEVPDFLLNWEFGEMEERKLKSALPSQPTGSLSNPVGYSDCFKYRATRGAARTLGRRT